MIAEAERPVEYGIAAAHEAALHPPAGKRWYRQRWLWVMTALTLVVVGVRIALNPVATALLHRALADIDGYQATFDPVQVSIIPLSMTVPNLVVVQDDAKGIEPIVRVPRLEARVRWRKLLRGQIVASASLERAKFVITFGVSKVTPQLAEAARKGAEELKKNEFNFGAILEKVIPLRVDRIEAKDCEFLLTDATDGALPQFWVSEVQLVVDNLVTRKTLDEDVPLMLTLRALVAKTGVLKVLATANLHAEKPAFTGQAQLDGLRLESLYSWTKAKAGLSVKGDLNVFVNFNSAEGKLSGDVKVIARNIPSTWFYIIAPDAPGGMAWVLAAGFTLQGDLTQLPIAMFPEGSNTPVLLPPIIYAISGTPLPLNPPAPGAQTAKVIQLAKVRVGPGLGYMEMGLLDVGTVVVVTGRIKGNAWLQIEYPSGLDGRGWVLAELVKFEGDFAGMPFFNQLATNIPKEDEAPEQPLATETLSADVTPVDTPIPFTETPALPMGITLAQINARSGPASSFASYGLLDKNQPVTILGRTLNGIWFQIQYPAAPNGVAWVAAEYVQVMKNIEGLPYFDNSGTPLPTP